ncbi:FecR family protein [Nisaea sp.]|uniref:FecR family protein n=1 Tax=Nisaea sp. TaxID=2024842 RepID=UPI0032649593
MQKRRLTRTERKRHLEVADWLLRNRSGAGTADDRQAFVTWLDQAPENRAAYEAAERVMGEASLAIKSDPALETFRAVPARHGRKAAGIVGLLALCAFLFTFFDGRVYFEADAISGPGEVREIALEDGSKVLLNASSAIVYDYSDSRRTLRLLRGQAHFDVARDPGRPFTVEVGDVRVTALGTAFDIRKGKKATSIAVLHNAVMLETPSDPGLRIRLDEGELVSQSASGRFGGISKVDPASVLAWRRGQLVVDNADLAQVAEEIERRFYGHVLFADRSLGDRKVSGTLVVSETDAALNFLEQALGVKSIKAGPLIVLY